MCTIVCSFHDVCTFHDSTGELLVQYHYVLTKAVYTFTARVGIIARLIIVSPVQMYTGGGYYGLVVITPRPLPQRPQTLHRSHNNFLIGLLTYFICRLIWVSKIGPV